MFFSLDTPANRNERVPLTAGFNKKHHTSGENPDETPKGKPKKDYTPIIHSPFGSKKPPVIHTPPAPPKPKPEKKKKKKQKVEIKEPPKPEPPKPPPPKHDGPTHLDGTPLKRSEVELLSRLVCKWKDYSSKRKGTEGSNQFRKGPAPLDEESGKKKSRKFVIRCSHGTLDSDVESLGSDDDAPGGSKKKKKSVASNKGLILYFAKLAVTTNVNEDIDLGYVNSLVKGGADVNASDRSGQTVLHEVARAWHTDVAKFLIDKGAKINKGDKFGRTPLHLAAAVGYVEMVEFLVGNGANLHCKTKGEKQTPVYYAARNNAVATLKVLLKLGASITDRDYKSRTALHVAAENGRIEAARMLLEAGAPAAVYDDEGNSCLTFMIEKMPGIAAEALEQFCSEDRALRKKFYYLNYLEKKLAADDEKEIEMRSMRIPERQKAKKAMEEEKKKNPKSKKEIMRSQLAKSPLEVIVEFNELELVMHPAVVTLIDKKWMLFGKREAQKSVLGDLLYALIWSIAGTFMPDQKKLYSPVSEWVPIIVLEAFGVIMTIYFMAHQIIEARVAINRQKEFKAWHIEHTERDLEYCHPRWPEEQRYLDQELERLRRGDSSNLLPNGWVVIDWAIHFAVWVIIITRIAAVFVDDDTVKLYHIRIFALSLVLIWLRILKSCLAFQSLGPFITLLGHVVDDTVKFGFLFFEFFIPYACAFWMLFGGAKNSTQKGGGDISWVKVNDVIFTIYQMTLIENINWNLLFKMDRFMAQIVVGTYVTLSSIVCLNLYIALMADTFARVYQNAKANAMLQQAEQILAAERRLSKKKKIDVLEHIHVGCAPLEIYASDEKGKGKANPGNRVYDRVNRHTDALIDQVKEILKQMSKDIKTASTSSKKESSRTRSASTASGMSISSAWQEKMEKEMSELKTTIDDMKTEQNKIFTFLQENLGEDETEA